MRDNSSYLYSIRQEKIEESVEWLLQESKQFQFDAVAVRGTSGIVAGAILAYELGKVLCVVRKPATEKSHAYSKKVECLGTLKEKFRYIIVDDMRGTGQTCRDIEDALREEDGVKVGILLYHYKFVEKV